MILSVCVATVCSAATHTDVLTDSTNVELREVKVTAKGSRLVRIDRTGSLTFGREAMEHAPRMFGEGDALRFMLTMPGVSSASDYLAGASIDGMGYAQNEYRLNGIPVHFPYHFSGIFSVFNPRMYDSVRVGKSIHGSGATDVTGGTVDVSGRMNAPERPEGEANVGMIASSGYVALPLGKRFSIAASGRISYLNLLYAPLLRNGQMDASYGFGDADAVATGQLSDADMLRLTFHFNKDNLTYDDRDFTLITGMRWNNLLAGACWQHDGDRLRMDHNLWFSRFANSLQLTTGQIRLKMPSAIAEAGVRGEFGIEGVCDWLDLSWGYSLRACSVNTQEVEMSGFGSLGARGGRAPAHAISGKIWGEGTYSIGRHWRLTAGLDAAMVSSVNRYRSRWIDPRVSVTYGWMRGNATVHIGGYHQWLHQVGFSEMGMSSNFKLAPSSEVPVERGVNMAVAFSHRVTDALSVSADGFFKRIADEPEYQGAVLDIINTDYRAENYINVCKGYNAGGNVALRLNTGNVTAMATYGYCIGRRRTGDGGYFDAAMILNHTATFSGLWRIGRHWSVSAVMNVASGRPYTPVKALYFIGEKIMMEYGARNSANLPLYHRLDAGADYEFHTGAEGRFLHRLNFSIVNVYGRRNVEMSTFTADPASGRYMRRDVSSLFRMLPSVSYTIIW